MLRLVVDASRMVAVHNQALAEHLRAQFPAAEIDVIPMGVPAVSGNAGVRARHGIPQSAIVFGCYGKVTAAKRIEPMLGALARVARRHPSAHLLIAGDASPEFDVERAAAERGIAGNVTIAGYVDDEALDGYLQAADVCVCLRWPSTGETSASWLRRLAAGKATIITNLVQLSDVPRLGRMADSYAGVIRKAMERPIPKKQELPRHLETDATALARRLTKELGVAYPF